MTNLSSRHLRIPLAVLLLFALQGCLAKAAVDAVTLPVKVVGKAVDLATTSQSEADEKRGRKFRKEEEKLGKLMRKYEDVRKDCAKGNSDDCAKAEKLYAQIQKHKQYLPPPGYSN